MHLGLAIYYSIFVGFFGLLAWAVVSDVTTLRIPNFVPLSLSGLYLLFIAFAPAPVDWVGGLIAGGFVFIGGTVLFALRVMGGGDVKLMAVVALWAGPDLVPGFLAITAISGGVMALLAGTPLRFVLGYAIHFMGPRIAPAIPVPAGVLPYGLAIGCGGAFVALQLLAF
ncbi:MAG: pilus assembly protein CpaA [Rhodospirillales bacterium]|jgi:prepilin peptidase CpaA|nr:pilus assembly protein CpaA [Rhodospirillales bacterium]